MSIILSIISKYFSNAQKHNIYYLLGKKIDHNNYYIVWQTASQDKSLDITLQKEDTLLIDTHQAIIKKSKGGNCGICNIMC